MSDPLQRLSSFDGGDPVPPLPAAEVRRRGDRLRRRQTVLAGVGAALVVAVVVTPLAVLGARGDSGSNPQPAPAPTSPAPSQDLPDEVSTSRAVAPEPAPSETPPRLSETPSETPPAPPASSPSSGQSAADVTLLGTVPLAAGWPEAGGDYALEQPGSGVEPFAYEACGSRLAYPDVVDRLRTRLSGPEDNRTRQLFVFDDAQGAVAYVAGVRDFYAACPEEDTGDGLGQAWVTDVRPTQVGGQSYAVVRSVEADGNPAIGLEVLHVVRLGRAVLVDTASNEGSGVESRIRSQIDQQTAAGAPVVAAMCAFTEAGC